MRLDADADPTRWVPVTGSLGLRGRRHRKKAIGMLLAQANAAMGATPRTGGGRVAAWAMSQAVPMLLRKADGRVLVWVWKDDPELVVALAQVHQATPQLRAAQPEERASEHAATGGDPGERAGAAPPWRRTNSCASPAPR